MNSKRFGEFGSSVSIERPNRTELSNHDPNPNRTRTELTNYLGNNVNKTGRPSSYSPETAEEICQRMVNGQGLLKICSDEGMPDRSTVYRWLEANQDFRDRYARAREALMDFYAEQILTIAFDESGDIVIEQDGNRSKAVANHAKVQRDRLKVDSLKWITSRLFPKRYGDKTESLGQNDQPKQITFRWQTNREPPESPRQVTHQRAEPPADLTERDWALLLQLLELVKRTVPTNDDRPPEEIFGVMREALLAHFRGYTESPSANAD